MATDVLEKEHEHEHEHALAGDPRRRPTKARFFWLIVGILGITALLVVRSVTAGADGPSLSNQAQDFLTLSIAVIVESMPFVILGILLSILVQIWIPDHIFVRYMPRNPILRRMALSLLGMFLPVCECGNVPLARGLVLKGFTVPESMTFLIAAPILNPITIITTHQAFGFDDGILVARLLGGFLIANIIGWLYSKHPNPEALLAGRFAAECRVDDGHGHGVTRWQKSVDLFVRETGIILPALFIGSMVAGGVQVLVPREILVSVGSDPLWSIVAMMVLAFVISICASVDAFFILPFASTFLPGSIVVFLVFGPIIDIKMLALMRTTFTTTVLIQLTILVGLMAALLGLVVNYVA